jgi:hemoglobin
MPTTHRGTNIGEQEYLAIMDGILAAPGEHGLGQTAQNEAAAVLYSPKNPINRV